VTATTAALRDALAAATERLAVAGCSTPRLDAELLAAEALGVDRARLLIDAVEPLGASARERFEAMVARREAREPVAYILGRKAYRHIELRVDRRVLIPRPESELVVEAALELPHGARVVDVGTGSGAIALALKHERPDLRVTATDVSEGALEVARDNARRLGLEVEMRVADLLDGAGGPFDAVLANVPYVARGDYERLDPEIATHEPEIAVVTPGGDGLEMLRRLVGQLGATPFVAMEFGLAQEDAVTALLREGGYDDVQTRRDLAGIERVAVARRR
jgi:release factor glutamine methyltransferase